jgi:hypothetical protein
MSFSHPSQHQHKLAGMAKAAASPKTPEHLRAHLQKRVQEGNQMKINNLRRPSGKIPQQQTLNTTDQADIREKPPMDKQSFEDTSTAAPTMMGAKVGSVRKQPSPAGTRPMNVTASVRPPRAPGLVASQGSVRNARPSAPGLNQNLSANIRPPRAAGLNQSVSPVLKTHKLTTVPAQKNRNVRPGSANPGFYNDF